METEATTESCTSDCVSLSECVALIALAGGAPGSISDIVVVSIARATNNEEHERHSMNDYDFKNAGSNSSHHERKKTRIEAPQNIS